MLTLNKYHLRKIASGHFMDLKTFRLLILFWPMAEPKKRKPGRPPTGRISVHVFLDKKLDEELSKIAAREGVHRSVIVERALAKELRVSVNHNNPGYREKALKHLLTAEKLLSAGGAKNP